MVWVGDEEELRARLLQTGKSDVLQHRMLWFSSPMMLCVGSMEPLKISVNLSLLIMSETESPPKIWGLYTIRSNQRLHIDRAGSNSAFYAIFAIDAALNKQ